MEKPRLRWGKGGKMGDKLKSVPPVLCLPRTSKCDFFGHKVLQIPLRNSAKDHPDHPSALTNKHNQLRVDPKSNERYPPRRRNRDTKVTATEPCRQRPGRQLQAKERQALLGEARKDPS